MTVRPTRGAAWLLALAAIASLAALPMTAATAADAALPSQPAPVAFDWFEYRGEDAAFATPLPPGHYRNPVLAGFHADPSVVAANGRFYLVNSSFTFFPGIPVFESADLVHWTQVGNVIERPTQLDFDGLGSSRGIFAPTIAFHDGTFYVATTAVDAGGNFIATARDPAGPWSDPHWLPTIGGIDPSLFFDDDGKVYLLNNDEPPEPARYDGHRAIWMQQVDLATLTPFGPRRVLIDGGVDPSTNPIWIEGPHIYKVDGGYVMSAAEGGTSWQHSQVVLRSRDVWGPYVPYEHNPVLTQRDLPAGRALPVTNAGHADFVQGPDGSWWAVFLASRNYDERHYNTGRETWLLPVQWHDGWPRILEPGASIPYAVPAPAFMRGDAEQAPATGNFTWRDEFDDATLGHEWMQLRVPKMAWVDLRTRPGSLSLRPSQEGLESLRNPAFVAHRQQHLRFEASSGLQVPAEAGTDAGLAAFQNEAWWYFLGVRRAGDGIEVFLERSRGEERGTVATRTLATTANVQLKIAGDGGDYDFGYDAGAGWQWLAQDQDGHVLSTDDAGGFIGAMIGPFARTAPIYRDTSRSADERAADLVARMTLAEKAAQMQNAQPPIPRLGVPANDLWNEALHGVARAGRATVFPQAIGLAATFDAPLLHEVADAIGEEGRAKHEDAVAHGDHGRYRGLNFWSPNINIFRDPRWGRGQETYGEDPYLTSRMGVAFVRGLQGDDPLHRRVDATAKHFAVHSGPEAGRHEFDVRPSRRDLYETYLPAFRALVQEADVAAVMGAYNRVYGESASASHFLLEDVLRRDWGFTGYVVSDCGAVEDIWKQHHIVATPEEAAALAVHNGLDLECGESFATALPAAVQQGLVSEADIDRAVTRLFASRFRLGMFDPPGQGPWASVPYAQVASPAHDALARRAAIESIVLLKNDGILPLSPDLHRVAVIGPTADEPMSLLGNYYGTPDAPTTILQGLRAALPSADVVHARGADLVQGRSDPRAATPIATDYLRPAADSPLHGLRGEYFRGTELAGTPVLSRIDPQVAFRWDRSAPTDPLVREQALAPAAALAADTFSVRWTGQLLAPVDGRYELHVAGNDGVRLRVDGELVIDAWTPVQRLRDAQATLQLQAGHAYDIVLEYFENDRDAEVRLAWRLPDSPTPLDEALAAARAAQVVVFVGGLTGDVEGEEMEVDYPGFAGGDRTDLRLPQSQQDLLQAVQATGTPVVLVLTTGSALAVDWAREHLPGIVVAWYPGQRGGDAVADVLLGKENPGGRLPVTFYRGDEVLPPFADYSMQGRTYRYFGGEPLYPFGFGLSYTTFAYSGLHVAGADGDARQSRSVTVTVTNTGARAGDEVVQLYLAPASPQRPRAIRELRGFQRVHLQPGEAREVTFEVQPDRDLTWYDEAGGRYAVDPGEYEVQVGASSADIRQRGRLRVTAVAAQ